MGLVMGRGETSVGETGQSAIDLSGVLCENGLANTSCVANAGVPRKDVGNTLHHPAS